jgi:predicted AlkP superfamily pyrophosphatase or phosphodiesterase
MSALLSTILATSLVPFANRVVIVSWDGAPDWVVDRLLQEGKLPNVNKLPVRAESMIPAFPSKTAVGHVAMFTGCWPNLNGVTGNSVPMLPASEFTHLQTRSGFDATSHLVEPLWITAARQGKKVVALSAAGSFPPAPDQDLLRHASVNTKNFVEFSGFEATIEPGRMLTQPRADEQIGEQTFTIEAFDDPEDPSSGFDSVRVRQGKQSAVLKPAAASSNLKFWSPAFRVTQGNRFGNVYFRLFALNKETGAMDLYQRKVSALQGTEDPLETSRYLDAYGGFHDDAFGIYQRGAFGEPIYEGGSGDAENRLLEIVRQDCEFLKRSYRYALRRWSPDLLFHYTPMTDSAGHTWMGVLDPESPRYDAAIAAKIMPYYEAVFQLQDDWLGDMMAASGPNTTFLLVSDHGMTGSGIRMNLNRILEQSGLLAYDGNGRIDLPKTKALFPPYGDFFMVVNGTDRLGGIVSPSEKSAVLDAAESALRAARVPGSNSPAITHTWRSWQRVPIGIGGITGGDLYLDFAAGIYPSSGRSATVFSDYDHPVIGGGTHGFFPLRPKMRAIFYAGKAGSRVRAIGDVKQIDVTPTVCRLLGIRPPESNIGTAIQVSD